MLLNLRVGPNFNRGRGDVVEEEGSGRNKGRVAWCGY